MLKIILIILSLVLVVGKVSVLLEIKLFLTKKGLLRFVILYSLIIELIIFLTLIYSPNPDWIYFVFKTLAVILSAVAVYYFYSDTCKDS